MQLKGMRSLKKVELSRVVCCAGSKLPHASQARCLLPSKMMSKSALLFMASMAIGAFADGNYPWQAPSSTDSMLIPKFSHPYLSLFTVQEIAMRSGTDSKTAHLLIVFSTRTEPLPYGEYFGQPWVPSPRRPGGHAPRPLDGVHRWDQPGPLGNTACGNQGPGDIDHR